MRECPNCELLKQRISDLKSELLVMKIAAFENKMAAVTPQAEPPAMRSKKSTRPRIGADQHSGLGQAST